jgi:microcystin-dependent protein
VVLCTASTSTTFTIERGWDGTTAVPHDPGALVEHTTSALDYREAGVPRVTEAERDALAGDDLWDGRVVFTTDVGRLEVKHSAGWVGVIPIGVVLPFSGATAPSGWVLAQGQEVSRTGFAALFALIGTTYGVGDGSTTFNVPDLRQRFPMGVAASGTGNVLGAVGGSIDHVHTNPSTSSTGAHTHTNPNTASDSHSHTQGNTGSVSDHTHSYSTLTETVGTSFRLHIHTNDAGPLGTTSDVRHPSGGSLTGGSGGHAHTNPATGSDAHSHTQSATGSSGSHSHTQGNTGTANPPFIALNYIIRV